MINTLNLANSLFTGYNNKRGILISGYEWGFSQKDQRLSSKETPPFLDKNATTTFSNKTAAHGPRALAWRYDNRIHKWFELWGHPLNREGLGGSFEKCLVQTNWCNTQGHHMEGSYHKKLSSPVQVDNFLRHIARLEPALILCMGSAMMDILQAPSTLSRFTQIVGPAINPPQKIQKNAKGRRFKIGFQQFERCSIVSLPHPSSSIGLRDDYIALFSPEIGDLIASVRIAKGCESS